MNLVIDVGNTIVKTAVFFENTIVYQNFSENFSLDILNSIALQFPDIKASIVCTVKEPHPELIEFLCTHYNTILFDHNTKTPINNRYKSPETLGKDRLAAVIGASVLHKNKNCLIIDAGTCITYDFIDEKKNYSGGAISPGIQMRFKALHNFTDKLPLVKFKEFNQMIGETTEQSILSGVVNGIIAEVSSWISFFEKKHPGLIVIVCGGDTDFFADRLKSSIFAYPNLVLDGLNEIINYNEYS